MEREFFVLDGALCCSCLRGVQGLLVSGVMPLCGGVERRECGPGGDSWGVLARARKLHDAVGPVGLV
jgi:hypothetical protein